MVTIKQAIEDLSKCELLRNDRFSESQNQFEEQNPSAITTSGELIILLRDLQNYRDAEEQGLLLENPKDLENAILNRMKEFMDEWRHYSESSTDHFGGKADSMETAMKIVKGAFEQALEPKTTTKQHTTTNPVDKRFDEFQEGGIYQATVTYNVNSGVFVKLKGEVDCLCSFPTCGTFPVPGQKCTVTVTQKVIAEDGTKKTFGKFVTLD